MKQKREWMGEEEEDGKGYEWQRLGGNKPFYKCELFEIRTNYF